MELRRSQDKEILGMPSILGFNSPNGDSSSKLSSGNTIFNPPQQTLDHHLPKPIRELDPNPNPNPDPVPSSPITATLPQSQPSISSSILYKECLKNHAAATGGHVLDGCGEFMPSVGEEGSQAALQCAACDCHRNFHRKEIEGESHSHHVLDSNYNYYINPNYKDSARRSSISTLQLSATHEVQQPHVVHHPHPLPFHHHHLHHSDRYYHHNIVGGGIPPPTIMTFGGRGGTGTVAESSSEDLNLFQSNYNIGHGSVQQAFGSSKKRFRTKFSQDQKDRMMEFADKLGWRIQKHDDQEVQQFCSQVGVKRQVFKVWMHNNKQAMKKNKEE